jgi:hypothetical protein
VLYHGVRHTPSGCLYRLGLALFDLGKPEQPLLRGDSWIFGPEADYERRGDVNDVVFPCGYTMNADGDTINLYYGAADCSTALARTSVRSLLECWMPWKLRTPAASIGLKPPDFPGCGRILRRSQAGCARSLDLARGILGDEKLVCLRKGQISGNLAKI